MKYHINARGEAGPCSAEKACPFGELEEDHYSSPEAARQAYEEKHKTTSWIKATKDSLDRHVNKKKLDSYIKEVHREQEALEKEQERLDHERREFVQGMKLPTSPYPEEVPKGHYKTLYGPEVGSPSELGGTVVRVSEGEGLVTITAKDGQHEYTYTAAKENLSPRKVWVDEPDPELVARRQEALDNFHIEDFYLNHMGVRSTLRRTFDVDYSDVVTKKAKHLMVNLRAFKVKAKELEKDGKPNPYLRAYQASAPNPHIDYEKASAFSYLVRGKELPANPHAYGYSNLRSRVTVHSLYGKGSLSHPDHRAKLLADRQAMEEAKA